MSKGHLKGKGMAAIPQNIASLWTLCLWSILVQTKSSQLLYLQVSASVVRRKTRYCSFFFFDIVVCLSQKQNHIRWEAMLNCLSFSSECSACTKNINKRGSSLEHGDKIIKILQSGWSDFLICVINQTSANNSTPLCYSKKSTFCVLELGYSTSNTALKFDIRGRLIAKKWAKNRKILLIYVREVAH